MVEGRRFRMQILIDKWFDSNESAFGRAVGRSPSQVSDMLAGRKSFGSKVARRIEEALWANGYQVAPFYLDGIPGTWTSDGRSPIIQEQSAEIIRGLTGGDDAPDVVQIPQLDVVASMGPGAQEPGHEDVVAVLRVHEGALRAARAPSTGVTLPMPPSKL